MCYFYFIGNNIKRKRKVMYIIMIINKKYKTIGSIVLAIIVALGVFIKYSLGGKSDLNKNNDSDIFIDEEIKDKTTTPGENDSSHDNVTKNTSNYKEIVVEIKGEVKNPNIYRLNENNIIQDLINKAGGLTESADISKINRAEKLQDHVSIVIPNKNDTNAQMTLGNSTSANDSKGNTLININTASNAELESLPGIGPSKAKSIIEYREKNGGFKSVDEIKNIKGIGQSSFEKLKDKITI